MTHTQNSRPKHFAIAAFVALCIAVSTTAHADSGVQVDHEPPVVSPTEPQKNVAAVLVGAGLAALGFILTEVYHAGKEAGHLAYHQEHDLVPPDHETGGPDALTMGPAVDRLLDG